MRHFQLGFDIDDLEIIHSSLEVFRPWIEVRQSYLSTYIEDPESRSMGNTTVIDKLIMRSCKAAVKAIINSTMEIEELIEPIVKLCKNPFSCPHGRPHSLGLHYQKFRAHLKALTIYKSLTIE